MYFVHGEKQGASSLSFLNSCLGIVNCPLIYRVGKGFLHTFLLKGKTGRFFLTLRIDISVLCRKCYDLQKEKQNKKEDQRRKQRSHLYILHCPRLSHTQHVEQLQDQLFDVLQGILLCFQGWVDLLLYLEVGDKQEKVAEWKIQKTDWNTYIKPSP